VLHENFEVLREKTWASTLLLTLKYIFEDDMLPIFEEKIVSKLNYVYNHDGIILAETVLIYIVDRSKMSNINAFYELVRSEISEDTGEKLMTIAEELEERGWQRGKQEAMTMAEQLIAKGKQEAMTIAAELEKRGWQRGTQEGIDLGLKKAAIVLLESGFDLHTVAKKTGLDITEVEALQEVS
jgi:predicted transposase YdaD